MESIRFKLWTTIIALVFVILTPIWYFQVVRLADSYSAARRNDTEMVTAYLRNQLQTLGYVDNFMDVVETVSIEHELCVFIYDKNGEILKALEMQSSGSACLMNMLVEDQQKALIQYVSIIQAPLIDYHVTSLEDYPSYIYGSYVNVDKDAYLLIVSGDVAPVNRVLQTIKDQLMMITIPVILVASIIAFIIARTFSKPITKLSQATKEMAKGHYETRVEVDSDDEIGILQKNFNNMAEEISHFEEMQRDLIANVSHDLKTPLTMIRGYAETIKDLTGDNKAKREQQLDIIIEESNRLNALVNDILNLSKYQSGQIALDYSDVDLHDMITSTLEQYTLLEDNQGFSFRYIGEGPAMVRVDQLRMKQVLYNILNNAINHTGDDKVVMIRLLTKGNRYRVEIQDTGMGIPKEELSRIWDRYYKLDKSGKRRVAGTGIGLSIVKGILSAHEALFGVESELHKGATFWFELRKIDDNDTNTIEL